ncbi:MAG TPA: UvrD-helicase domain-containing protein [Pseudonocardiaceae bacterium]
MVEFTTAQRKLFESPGGAFIPACPGAGKTQAMVQRFISQPGRPDRRGLALLSFTNAAIFEVEERCARRGHLLKSPNYVGTIDGFINHFVVGPAYKSTMQQLPTFRDTWSRSHSGDFQEGAFHYQLDWFAFDAVAGTATLLIERVPGKERSRFSSAPYGHGKAERRALGIWKRLIATGYIDCTQARVLMQQYLSDAPIRARLQGLLQNRFYEIIIDEGQDCSSDDLLLLEFLHSSNINLVMVADFDQAIYEFRGSDINGVREFSSRLPQGDRLDDNFRSSPSICRLVDHLRGSGDKDRPAGPFKDINTPVHLLEVDQLSKVHTRVSEVLKSEGVELDDFIYLAHRTSTARACAQAGSSQPSTNNKLVRLGMATNLVCAPEVNETTKARRDALVLVQHALRDLASDDTKGLPDDGFFEAIGETSRTFTEGCLRIALQLNATELDPKSYLVTLKKVLQKQRWNQWADASRLRSPKGSIWPDEVNRVSSGIRWSTVHGFKGLQSPAVGLAISSKSLPSGDPSGVQLWKDSQHGEPRRVLYVGASRAQKLLILLADRSSYSTISTILSQSDVPHLLHPK